MNSFERDASWQENQAPNDQQQLEEGELQIIDEGGCIISDRAFQFGYDHNRKINWRNVSKADLKALVGGEDLSDILLNLEDIAYSDLREERNCAWISNEGRDAMKVMQAGMQYLMFAQKQMLSKLNVLQDYAQKQEEQAQKLERIHNNYKSKMRKYKKINEKLNEQAIHFEVMINKLRPDLMNDRMKRMLTQPHEVLQSRPDVRLIDSAPHQVVTDILRDKGLLQDGQKSVFDYFASLDGEVVPVTQSERSPEKDRNFSPEQEGTGHYQDQLAEIMEQLKKIEQKVGEGASKKDDGGRVIRSSSLGDELEESVGSSRSNKSKRSQKKAERVSGAGANGQWRQGTPIQEEEIEEDVQEDHKVQAEQLVKQSTSIMGEEVEVEEELAGSSNPTNSRNLIEVAHNIDGSDGERQYQEREEEVKDDEIGKAISIEDLSSQLEKSSKKAEGEYARFKSTQYDHHQLQEIENIAENQSEQPKGPDGMKSRDEEEIKEHLEEDEEEYKDDFEVESQVSETKGDQIGLSASGLPPKSSKGLVKPSVTLEEKVSGSQKKMQDMYNINLAESQMSMIDFELSQESRGLQGSIGGFSKKGSVIQNLMKKNLDDYESNEWDSNDFEVSDSNFSQSYRSKGGNPKAKKQSAGGSKQPFYQYEQKKFSSYDKPEYSLQDADFD